MRAPTAPLAALLLHSAAIGRIRCDAPFQCTAAFNTLPRWISIRRLLVTSLVMLLDRKKFAKIADSTVKHNANLNNWC